MGRPVKVKNGKVVTLRLPKEFLDTKPETEKEYGDWLRKILLDKDYTIIKPNKKINKFFYEFFIMLVKEGVITTYLTDEIITKAEEWGESFND